MSQIKAILFRRERFWLVAGLFVAFVTCFSLVAYQFASASLSGAFTVSTVGNYTVPASAPDVLLLDVVVPDAIGGGDFIFAITFGNAGTATYSDISAPTGGPGTLDVWMDGANTICDAACGLPPVDDLYVGPALSDGAGGWFWPFGAPLGAGVGSQFFVVTNIVAAPTDGATLQIYIPLLVDVATLGAFDIGPGIEYGVFVASGPSPNQGPTDFPVGIPPGPWVSDVITIDAAGPLMTEALTWDIDGDARVGYITAEFDEAVADATVDVSDFTITGCNVGSSTRTIIDAFLDDPDFLVLELIEDSIFDTGLECTVNLVGTITDTLGNARTSDSIVTDDNVRPRVITTTPAHDGKLRQLDKPIKVVFSEEMHVGFHEGVGDTSLVYGTDVAVEEDSSYDASGTLDIGTNANKQTEMLIQHDDFVDGAIIDVYISEIGGGEEAIDLEGNSLCGGTLGNGCDEGGHWFQFEVSETSGGPIPEGDGGAVQNTVTVSSPNGGEVYNGGDSVNLMWNSTGAGIASVNLSYTLDGGFSYTSIVSGTANDGSEAWTVPNAATSKAKVKVEARDSGGATLYTDTSDENFSIIEDEELPPEAPPVEGIMTRTGANNSLPGGLQVDDLIKLPNDGDPNTFGDTTVFYVGLDAKRHPFPNAAMFFTWYENFDSVQEISPALMAQVPIGTPVLVRPGTHWVKIQSASKTYWVEPGSYVLRHIADEATAVALGGDDWNKNIIDVEPTFFTKFEMGSPISMDDLDNSWPEAALMRHASDPTIFYVQNGVRREVKEAGFGANHFQDRFVETFADSFGWPIPASTPISGLEDSVFSLQFLMDA